MLTKVKGIGCILIGEGDLGQELGIPRQYEHPELLKWMKRVVDTCKKHNVVVGHPHVEAGNAERIVKEGYRFLMCAPVQGYGHLEAARKHQRTGVTSCFPLLRSAKRVSKVAGPQRAARFNALLRSAPPHGQEQLNMGGKQ